MIASSKLKQRYCKDNNLSIPAFDDDQLFFSRLKHYDKVDHYTKFLNFVADEFGSEQAYFEYYNKLKDKIIDYIKSSEAFVSMNNASPVYFIPHEVVNNLPQSDVYKPTCVGETYISIDMSKANFSALVEWSHSHHCATVFADSYDYDEWMKKFTEYDYFAKSKYIRQVVFGNCNPKRQISYAKYLMSYVVRDLVLNGNITESDIFSVMSDEVILKANSNISYDGLKEVIKRYEFPLKIEQFTVGRLSGSDAYVKLYEDGTYTLKCVNPDEMPFIYAHMKGQPVVNADMYFLHNNKLAKFIDAPEIRLICEKGEADG